MAINVAINGFGRIGRLVLRHGLQAEGINFVAVNDLTSPDVLAHLLKYDSVHGRFPLPVKAMKGGIRVGDYFVEVLSETQPERLPWEKRAIDVVIESTGRFTARADAARHLTAGARKGYQH